MALVTKAVAGPALRLFGAATAARKVLGLPPPTEADRRLIAAGREQAIQAAGSDWQALFEAGGALSLEQAHEEALALASAALGIALLPPAKA
jgi:hypothetical protein